MFVKIYQYHVKSDKVDEFFAIQDKAANIYKKYIDFNTIYLNSKNDYTKWLEITRYRDEEEYKEKIKDINELEEIQNLFKTFQSLLLVEKSEMIEEDFIERRDNLNF